jgi:hypothetical protein
VSFFDMAISIDSAELAHRACSRTAWVNLSALFTAMD